MKPLMVHKADYVSVINSQINIANLSLIVSISLDIYALVYSALPAYYKFMILHEFFGFYVKNKIVSLNENKISDKLLQYLPI
jgi:hypothetical protein